MEAPVKLQVKEEFEKLLELVKGKRLILEIGTCSGGSLYEFMQHADASAEFVSIDLPGGMYGGEFGQPDEAIMQSWRQSGQTLHVIRADSRAPETIARVRQILAGRRFDFILIDGDHTYDGVKGDFEAYRPMASDVIAFHDIAPHIDATVGIGKFWAELYGDKTDIIADMRQGWAGIGVYRVHCCKAIDVYFSITSKLLHPIATFNAVVEKWFVYLHGNGAAYQEFYYRCTNCHRIITWGKIHSGKICCGGKVSPTTLRYREIFQLFFLPWTI